MICNNYSFLRTSDFSFCLKCKGNSDFTNILYFSIINSTEICNPIINQDCLFFNAEHVETMVSPSNKWTESNCLNIISSLGEQIKFVETKQVTFIGFNYEDIIIINNTHFFIVNSELIYPINNGKIRLLYPIVAVHFLSPYLLAINNLPNVASSNECYYSLGMLIVELYFFKQVKDANDLEQILHSIKLTKMYWFLKRCFIKRQLLYI